MFFIIVFIHNHVFAQLNDYQLKGGIQGFGLLPDMDFNNEDIKLSYLARAFLRIKVIDLVDLEIGAGYGLISGEDPSNVTLANRNYSS